MQSTMDALAPDGVQVGHERDRQMPTRIEAFWHMCVCMYQRL